MPATQTFSLDAVRTDGWFERIGEGIGSFQALCDIVGERFFAFSIITGARITALTVDRRNPEQTLVDFVVGDAEDEETQRLSLGDFRRRLVGALLADDPTGPPPSRETDVEALQRHIGVRYLLVAPLYGYSLRELLVEPDASTLWVVHDGTPEEHELESFRLRVRAHVREELERVSTGQRGGIDLSRVADAETASLAGDSARVVQLLGAWPAPLAIFLRTPEGQMLASDARGLIAKALALLGTACADLGQVMQAEEVFRLGVQYAGEGMAAADVFRRMGDALLDDGRAGEAIGAFRRALALGGDPKLVWPQLGRAFLHRHRFVAAYACLRHAIEAGVAEASLAQELRLVETHLGPSLTGLRALAAQG